MLRFQFSRGSAQLGLLFFIFAAGCLTSYQEARALRLMPSTGTPGSPQAGQGQHPPAPAPSTKSLDYYVAPQGSDANDGSQSHPWKTISHASWAIGPGATVHVAPGDYDELVETTKSGTASARIVYISDKKWGAMIDPKNRPRFDWKNTGNYTDIVDFDVRGDSCIGIGLGGSYQSAKGNNVHNPASGCNDSSGGAGIDSYDYSFRENDIIGNYVHDVAISHQHCGERQAERQIHGIYQSNYGGHISSNIVVDICGYGIQLWHNASHAVVTNNTVVKNRSGGVVIGSGDKPCNTEGCEGNDYTVVRNNIVAMNGNPSLPIHGITEEAADAGRLGTHNQYSHNLLYQNRGDDFFHVSCEKCIQGRDPGFVSPSSGDFHVKKDSPALGAGTDRDAPETNFDGKALSAASSKGGIHIGALGDSR